MKPLGQHFVHGITYVSDLLSPDGAAWDHAKVDAMFSADDAHDIKQIAIGGLGSSDYLAWNFTKSGQFSVRSAYHLCMSLKRTKTGRPESSTSVDRHKSWLALWNTNAPGKAKIHMWRLIKNGLAVGAELHMRKIKPGIFCTICGREETVLHCF